MKTEAFIDFLASGAGPAPRHEAIRRLGLALAIGLLSSVALGVGIHGVLPVDELLSVAWGVKSGYALLLLAGAGGLLEGLSKPLSKTFRFVVFLLAVCVAISVLGAMAVVAAPLGRRQAVLLGETWRLCSILVLVCSLPTLLVTLWALRNLAPVRLRYAGFAAGVFSGAVGALGYSVGCPEVSFLFVAVWYTMGIVLSGLLGMLLGPRVLCW